MATPISDTDVRRIVLTVGQMVRLFAVAALLSPIIPIFQALHLIFSNQDPLKLAQEEDAYHQSAQTAIANYGAMRTNQAIQQHGLRLPKAVGGPIAGSGQAAPRVMGSKFIGGQVGNMREGTETFRSSMDFHGGPGASGRTTRPSEARAERLAATRPSGHARG